MEGAAPRWGDEGVEDIARIVLETLIGPARRSRLVGLSLFLHGPFG